MRKPLSKKLRFEVLKRDGFVCQYCGQGSPQVVLHVDHVVPVSRGGANEIDNLVAACEECNSGKRATFHDSTLGQLVDLKARVRDLEAALEVMRARESAAREQAYGVAEKLCQLYDLELTPSSFEILADLVWRVGTESAQRTFTVAEYEVGCEPEGLWCRAVEMLQIEAAEWEGP